MACTAPLSQEGSPNSQVSSTYGYVVTSVRGRRGLHVPNYLLRIAAVDDSDVLCQNGARLAADLLDLWSSKLSLL